MIEIKAISFEEAERLARENSLALPIEQTQAWVRYQSTIPGRGSWGRALAISDNGKCLAIITFVKYQTHGYSYLRSLHGPVWVAKPTPQQEAVVFQALRRYIHKVDKSIVFVRLGAWYDGATEPVLSTIPYNSTVIVDLAGTDEEILARMRSRGRYDVRKALRESPAECADETDQANESFDEYYDVMVDTAQRDGFTPASKSTYHRMLTVLGKERCRFYVGRINGEVSNWCIVTINDNQAVYYYGSSRSDMRKLRAPDKLFYFMFCDLAKQGIESIDLMGIGSEEYPALNTLNQFKTKFTPEVTAVAVDRDLPVRPLFYKALQTAKRVRARMKR